MVLDRGKEEDDWLKKINGEISSTLIGNCLTRKGILHQNKVAIESNNICLDTGANHGNYIGWKSILRSNFDTKQIKWCNHKVKLGDGETAVLINKKIQLDLSIFDEKDKVEKFLQLDFFIIDSNFDGVIIGLETIMNRMFPTFIDILSDAKYKMEHQLMQIREEQWDTELKAPPEGSLLEPWSNRVPTIPEESEVKDPTLFPDDLLNKLRFMETSVDDSVREYLDLVESHVAPNMKHKCAKVLELLRSPLAISVFAPSEWKGLRVPEVDLKLKEGAPKLQSKYRPVRPQLYAAAYEECMRLLKYFIVVTSDSEYSSPLTIAPKSTPPYLRFCGDFRLINQWLEVPARPIPMPYHEIQKALQFKIFIDLDMANSFHQIPISEATSKLLTMATPWGLFRPKFLPEGIAPASGILQEVVRSIFKEFEEWIVVIFDNF